ncbi:MAG TPA: RyR domain-containing protein [Candidatus Bathyarchaeia archaeon]|nr:RyR domain-containing protein [Candidatus Bathyarchaeia archaeon]
MTPTKKTAPNGPAIAVAGDLSVDWFETETPPRGAAKGEPVNPRNWRTYPAVSREARLGGAWLVADLVRAATGVEVAGPPSKEARTLPADELVHSYVELGRFAAVAGKKDDKTAVYRVKSYKGFTGPAGDRPSAYPGEARPAAPALVVLDDAGNGFRDHQDLWPAALSNGAEPLVVVKMSRPLSAGPLFDHLRGRHAGRLVLVLAADDLRREGVKISRRLSWERTATDFVWQMASNPALLPLNGCAAVVVRFGVDGAILYSRCGGAAEAWLYYDPATGEDAAGEVWPGEMIGVGSAFTAGLAASMAEKGLDGVRGGVLKGLAAARRLWQAGFGGDIDKLAYPGPDLFRPLAPADGTIAEVPIPAPTAAEPADPGYWCILDTLTRSDLETIAYNFVLKGKDPMLDRVPSGRFRFLRTFDRSEIESFQGIKNLIGEYLASPSVGRPLSIAVFGAPGSGKSFGVTEVAESVAPGRLQKIEFNMSQMNDPGELVAAFHRVRDIALGGKIPIVFFDEFDSAYNGRLGWLKYFLAPMQDGAFSAGHDVHPVGRAIFVFAGGTASTYQAFCGAEDAAAFKAVKGPDFVSRLRGYVNIKGPNPVDDRERLFLVRRAQILRFQLEKSAPQILDGAKTCRIDPGILRAMIKVPEYRHGIRSILAVIEMSQLAGRQSFEQAALPSPEQLDLHVDADAFSRLVVRDVLLGSARETLAQAIHEHFRKDQAGKRAADDPAMADWAALDEGLKESNRRQADHIPAKLRAVGCDFAPAAGKAGPVKFAADEIETMAKLEHERWVGEKLLAGFRPGARDHAARTSPYLVPWDELDKKTKDIDRQAVLEIPKLLASAGFEIYRLRKG